MRNIRPAAQLIARLALGIGFILPVSDRLGFLGAPGSPGVAWGNWANFVTYTNQILPFLSPSLASVAGLLATAAEAVFGIGLMLGIKTREAALGSAVLTGLFGICMAIFLGFKAPFDYPVFVFTGAALLLSQVEEFKWSFDKLGQGHLK